MNKRARTLRQNASNAEDRLWYHLRNRQLCGYKYRRQHPVGLYIVDFVCIDRKLIIEADGSQHLLQQAYDKTRTRFLESRGYTVIRFWNDDILCRTDGVLEEILRHFEKTPEPATSKNYPPAASSASPASIHCSSTCSSSAST